MAYLQGPELRAASLPLESVRRAIRSGLTVLRTVGTTDIVEPMVPLFAGSLERDRKRSGYRHAAWHLGVTVREYRELATGARLPSFDRVGSDSPATAGRSFVREHTAR